VFTFVNRTVFKTGNQSLTGDPGWGYQEKSEVFRKGIFTIVSYPLAEFSILAM